MNKIGIIIAREYRTRVRKRSFIIMSILGPFIFAAFTVLPVWFASMKDTEVKTIAVVDSSHIFENKIPDSDVLKFKYLKNTDIQEMKRNFNSQGYWGVLYIYPVMSHASDTAELISDSQPNLATKSYIENALSKEIERHKLLDYKIYNIDEILKSVSTKVQLRTIKVKGGEENEGSTGISMVIGYVAGFLIYFFVLLFGTQVMRGIIEEKTNRIVEVIVSSVKPFELMMGKIVGIAGVGLTQFIIWVVLTIGIVNFAQNALFHGTKPNTATTSVMNPSVGTIDKENISADDNSVKFNSVMEEFGKFPIFKILGWFVFFFLGGYLLYASLFAVVGSAVDNETDTQQFMMPITMPLIFSVFVMINTINNPESSLSLWCSFIPLTSPVVMMVRIPFDTPNWQILLSAVILILTFLGTTWMAAKIYRTGILMYGKKVTYKELWKWLKYKA